MSRVQMIGVGAALTTFVSVGATATDARVGMLITAVQTALESDMEIELGLIVDGPHGALSVLDLPVVVALLVLLFGGLPVAVFGLLFDRQWAGVPIPRRPNLRVPYARLIFQIVSMGISALCLAVMGEALRVGTV